MLRIVEQACTITSDRSRGVIVVESDCDGPPFTEAFHELDSQDARKLAQSYGASIGIVPAFINGNVLGPYPVNSEGLSLEDIRDANGKNLPQTHKRMQPKHYRIEIPLSVPLR